jgi:myo-inositol-1(or 4)-monophosphatase
VSHCMGFPVVGEERGGAAPADGSAYWLVDPICGTRNFASGIPLYCVNLALVEGGQIALAVVGDSSTGEIHVAERGGGAWANKDASPRRLATSGESRTVIVEVGRSTGLRREHAARFVAGAIRADRWDLRALGTTLSLPYVAAGRVAAYVLFSVSAVHAGAGSLLVTEAGGVLPDIDGRPWTIQSDSIVASADSRLHRELLDLARAALSPPG